MADALTVPWAPAIVETDAIPLPGVWLHLGHAVRPHPWMRLLLGALAALTGVQPVLVGVGHGGLIAAGYFVIAGAIAAIRGDRRRPKPTHQQAGATPDAQPPRP
jgi:hypothetical protein